MKATVQDATSKDAADALEKHPGDLQAAFQAYDEGFRPTVEGIQVHAVEVGLEMFMPRSEEAIQRRNMQFGLGLSLVS
jgi:hypothetical protein